ncbi:nuclear transport factor 2 family protein [Herbiconiux moechotypicola]|uniref:DUF4440 domain-containing protein n=1 Tax=Herbiconiux moechotypicola TaxID=637393 RepID=A0ABN3DF55_9MICO|nr:nuclear transport factor 2 family protein [Herbiconiux moechotypicola]MCS5729354.1 nuclear transport factor 2 family protein [Herbiconiux moechotypicola]
MATVSRPGPEVERQLLEVESRRIRALIDGDVEALDRLFDERLVHVHAPGLTQRKEQLLEHVALRRAYLEITRGELDIRVVGDTAVLTGPMRNRLRTAEGGERTVEGVVTQVLYRDDDGEWHYLSFQMTPRGEQAWPALPSEAETSGVRS